MELTLIKLNETKVMNQLTSLPASVRNELNIAQELLQGTRYGPASPEKIDRAMTVLKKLVVQNPELGTVIFAAILGHRGIEITDIQEKTYYRDVDRKLLGFKVGTDQREFTDTTRNTRRIRLF